MTNEIANYGFKNLETMANAFGAVANEVTGTGFDGKDLLKLTQDGEWLYGQDGTLAPERVVVNVESFKRGYISWHNSAVAGEVMVPLGQDVPDPSTLPATPTPYDEQFSFECADPANPDVQLLYKTSSMGGLEAIKGVIGLIGSQLKNDPANVIPTVELSHSSYQNKKYGNKTIYKPVFKVVGWGTNNPTEAIEEAPEEAPVAKRTRRRPAA